MINSVQLKNFGPLDDIDWQNLGPINLVIGNNGCGKSFLLKALYSAIRTLEDYKRGNNNDSVEEILADKLYWTFQAEKIGDLVTKQRNSTLSFSLMIDHNLFSYNFDPDTTKVINILANEVAPRPDNSTFLPSKEVLSLFHIILESREHDKLFGFDDTYLDLAKALLIRKPLENRLIKRVKQIQQLQSTLNPNAPKLNEFDECQERLNNILGGKVEYDFETKRWEFNQGNQKFNVGVMAEGIKKIAILDTLLGNGHLNKNSIIFIDEPEANLHPTAISKLLDIVAILANHGIQFFIASHSYFVIKKLFLIAQKQKLSIPVLSKESDSWQQSDLLDDMPSNGIINESIRLYKEEVSLAFK
jgi:AAA15 family ATPase/GTPase